MGTARHFRPLPWLAQRPLRTLGLMTLAFLVSGALSVDLVRLLSANLAFIAEHGWLAIQDDALWQLGGLVLRALAATLGYLLFKLCKQALLQCLGRRD